MNENKNLILAIALSALVLHGWGFLSEKFMPANPPPKVEKGKVVPNTTPTTPSTSQGAPVAAGPTQARDRRKCTQKLRWEGRPKNRVTDQDVLLTGPC